MVFEKTLTDVVKGIRASKRDTALYISSCIAEIKTEINSTDPHTKGNALQKLTFLQMMGYNMSWASFATIEVMSDARFAYKRIGCLAASQTFTQDTDVILLTTNTLKKELRGAIGPGMSGVYEAGLALNCLSNIVTEDLARELLPDVTNLTTHPQPYLRKKAILCLLKLFIKYPQGLRLTFNRIQQCLLEDTNSSVTSCAVNVITELSNTNPKNYLVLAPSFFGLLTNSSNNWMLIKVVKLLGSLVAEEPRLARKLLDPLAKIVQNTQAKSLLFEGVYTITLCLPYCQKADGTMPSNISSIVALCAKTLKDFVQESDQNLKYLGLVGFGSLMVSHPKVLSAQDYRPLILACLSDEDITIRTRALDLLNGMATRKNIIELITQLLRHVDLATGSYKSDLVVKIIEICSGEKYILLTDFAWYMDVLVILARTNGMSLAADSVKLGPIVSDQMTDVALRVLPVRAYAVRRMIGVLLGSSKRNADYSPDKNVMPEVLPSAAWIVGEYSSLIDEAKSMDSHMAGEDEDELERFDEDSKGTYHAVIQALTDTSNVDSIEKSTQRIYIQAAMKVLAAASISKNCSDSEIESILSVLSLHLPIYMESIDPEVQERAFTSFHLLASFQLVDNQPIGMTEIEKKDDSDSDSSSDEEGKDTTKTSSITDDLLNLTMGSPMDTPKTTDMKMNGTTHTNSKVRRCREVSETLKYLLIPEHMKPVSAKAQKKKFQSAPDSIKKRLEKPLQLSRFSKMIAEDKARRVDSKNLEAVTFTQQTPYKAPEASHQMSMEGFGSTAKMPSSQKDADLLGSSNQPNNIQSNSASTALNSANRQQDPFYLNSSDQNGNKEESGQNRFGTIQLSDNDTDNEKGGKRKKKKKKDKKSRKGVQDADLQLFEMMGKKDEITTSRQSAPQISAEVEIYHSDEDDDNNYDNHFPIIKKKEKEKKSQLSSLANVDLTMPLRDDEVMPRNEHHVVKERKAESTKTDTTSKRDQKKKKSKTSKKRKEKKSTTEPVKPAELSENLLDFSTVQPVTSNPINAAFDDLLGLDTPPPPPIAPSTNNHSSDILPPTTTTNIDQPVSRKASKLWQQATIKVSSAKGGATPVDWSKLSLLFRSQESKKKSGSFTVTMKLQNGTNTLLNNIEVRLKGVDSIQMEDAKAGKTAESRTKVGPFEAKAGGYGPDIRGSLLVSGWSISIKVSLPSTFLLRPYAGLTYDQVSALMSDQQWASESVKLQCNKDMDMKNTLQQFLKAEEVESFGNDGNAILASQSTSGAIVLALIKISKSYVKVDVKSTDKKLVGVISSDLKRLLV